jgi:hypothetical protein
MLAPLSKNRIDITCNMGRSKRGFNSQSTNHEKYCSLPGRSRNAKAHTQKGNAKNGRKKMKLSRHKSKPESTASRKSLLLRIGAAGVSSN